jgi:hypothetical protein
MFKKDVKQDPKTHILVSKIRSFQLEKRNYIWTTQLEKLKKANPSLGYTTWNITPQIFETHSTSKQHETHLKKTSFQNLYHKTTQVM